MSFRLKIAGLVVGVVFAASSLSIVYAAPQKLTAALIGPLATAQGQGLQKFAERVKELSNGELVVEIYPDGQLGNQSES